MIINERHQKNIKKKNLRSSSNYDDGERNYDEKNEEVDIVVEDRSILIDASLKGNFTRFINHSQSAQISPPPTINSSNFPSWRFNDDDNLSSFMSMTTAKSLSNNNLETINVRINFKICQIFLQTKKVINRHEELRFDYWE